MMIKKSISILMLTSLACSVAGQSGTKYCDQTTSPYSGGQFPAGDGAYTKQLLFFDLSGVKLSNDQPSAIKTVTFNGVTYTLTLSGYQALSTQNGQPVNISLSGSDISTWGTSNNGQHIKNYYDIPNYKEVLYNRGISTTQVKVNFSVTAKKNGTIFPVDMVVYDPEATSSLHEKLAYTTNASPFSLLEKLGSGTIGSTSITGGGTTTVTYLDTTGSNVNALYVTSGYSPVVTGTATFGTNSGQGFGVAVRLYCDQNNDGEPDFITQIDSDGDGIPDMDDVDDDNDGIPDCVERGFSENMSDLFALNSNAVQKTDDPTGGSTYYPYQVQLTPNETGKRGQIWSKAKIDFSKSFMLRYQAFLGSKDGADGIAAVFHNDPAGIAASGDTGFGLGARGIKNGIVLELDTYNNGATWGSIPVGDISENHGMIWDSDDNTSNGLLTTAVSLGNIEDNKWHDINIYWDANTKTLRYTVQLGDGTVKTAGEHVFKDIVNDYFGGASEVYFGYTASTGSSTNDQRIKFVDLCSDFPGELDTDGDGIPDRLDLDSDGDGCPDSIEGADNVLVSHILPNGTIDIQNWGGIDGNGLPVLVNPTHAADTDNAIGQGIGYSKIAATSAGCACVKPAITGGTLLSANHGITALGRAGSTQADQWPMVRKGAWTVLESKTKGFVVNRIPTSAAVQALANPQQGMMVYDEEAKCLKIYVLKNRANASQGGFWKCLSYTSCPDNVVNK